MTVSKIKPLKNIGDLMDANADLMSQVYHDDGLSADEKLRSFSLGIRNQCSLSRDLQSRRAELARYGLLHQAQADDLQALRFIPPPPAEAPPAPASLPAPADPSAPNHDPASRLN